ncbi:MAG TPA: hypothetical protein VN954_07520, partial [Ktedonobacteraceae bacterium]|nr:hypothetical protein [Ktedonobacteraceae bacterium]
FLNKRRRSACGLDDDAMLRALGSDPELTVLSVASSWASHTSLFRFVIQLGCSTQRQRTDKKGENYVSGSNRNHDRGQGPGPLEEVLRGRLGLPDRQGLSPFRVDQLG